MEFPLPFAREGAAAPMPERRSMKPRVCGTMRSPMSFSNATPFAAIDVPMLDPNGREVVIVIVKAAFEVGAKGKVELADEPADLRMVEVLTNPKASPEDPRVAAKYPSDLCIEKRGTDVVVVGEAVSPKPVTSVDV